MSITNDHKFKLKSDFDPAGDQPKAINDLNEKMESVRELLFRFAWLISQVKKSNLISLI